MYFTDQPILQDFDQFLEYISQSEALPLTRDKGNLRSTDLLALNSRLNHPLEIVNPRPQQQVFSVLNTFFHIGNVAQLFLIKKNAVGDKIWLEIQKDRVQQYHQLTSDERYFFLLESFWCFVDWDEAYDCRAFSEGRFYQQLWQQPVGEIISIADYGLKRKGQINAPSGYFSAEIFSAFGFFDLIWDEKLTTRPNKYTFPYQSVVLSELGKTMLPILLANRAIWVWGGLDPFLTDEMRKKLGQIDETDDEEDMDNFGTYTRHVPDFHMEIDNSVIGDPEKTTFSSAFEEAIQGLKITHRLFPIIRPFVTGRLELSISLNPKCYREIAISSESTLQDLHGTIQRLFNFGNDHLYQFFMSGKENYRAGERYMDPRCELDYDEKPADMVRLGELGLYPGKQILYLFDFGSSWHFYVRVQGVHPTDKMPDRYQLLKSVGKSPKQYY